MCENASRAAISDVILSSESKILFVPINRIAPNIFNFIAVFISYLK